MLSQSTKTLCIPDAFGMHSNFLPLNKDGDGKRPTVKWKDRANLCSLEEAEAKAARGFGLGYSLTDTPLLFFDLDNAFDDEGNLRDWAEDALSLVKDEAAYHPSISGKGLHIFVNGYKPWHLGTKFPMVDQATNAASEKRQEIEFFDTARFAAIPEHDDDHPLRADNLAVLYDEDDAGIPENSPGVDALIRFMVERSNQYQPTEKVVQVEPPPITEELKGRWIMEGMRTAWIPEGMPPEFQSTFTDHKAAVDRITTNVAGNTDPVKRATAYADRMQVGQGSRNNSLYHLVKKAQSFGCSDDDARRVALSWNSALAEPLPPHEASTTINSALAGQPYKPAEDRPLTVQPIINVDGTIDSKSGGLPIVIVNPGSTTVNKACTELSGHLSRFGWDGVDDSQRIYNRSGRLSFINKDFDENITIETATANILRNRLSKCCLTVRQAKDKQVPADPSNSLIGTMLEDPEFHSMFKPLIGITNTPTLRPDGSLLQEPGYDKQSRLVYEPSADFREVRDEPLKVDAVDALNKLKTLVCDFPFKHKEGKHAWIALVLAMIGRPAIKGSTPLFAVDGNVAGSGKSKLAKLASLIATGTYPGAERFVPNDEEMDKRITASLMADQSLIMFDNATTEIGGACIDKLLSEPVWQSRVLGESRTAKLPVRSVFAVTGNNLKYRGDTFRRVLPIQLDSHEERPQERTGFKIRDIEQHVLDNRAEYVHAALTILRAYIAANRPDVGQKPFGSFQSFSDLVCGSIIFAGGKDPMNGVEKARHSNSDAEALELLVEGIAKMQESEPQYYSGITAAEMADELKKGYESSKIMREGFELILESPFPSAQLIGRRIQPYLNRFVACKRIEYGARIGSRRVYRVVKHDGSLLAKPQATEKPPF